MDWKSRIPGCFGKVDYKFAVHPIDENRAFDLLNMLRKESVSWEEFESEVRSFLIKGNCHEAHISDQIESVERHIRAWLR